MKLHRLILTNYRGIAQRDIEFPDSGVVVVCGANEIGKSSMIEALDLLLESKDRSSKKEVKRVKPTDGDVGSEVTAEISTGPYRFVYRKRFHKKCETQLTVLAPRREQLTGDEAHERVCAMLAETMDTELWHAQRVLQAASTTAVNLSGCEALSRALDVAAGAADALFGTEPLLIERIDAEYAQYFTPTGRPTGEWSAATTRLQQAEDEVERWATAVAEVEDRVRRHVELTDRLADLSGRQLAAGERHAAAQTAAGDLAELGDQLREAQLIATAAAATSSASSTAHTERLRLRTDLSTRTANLTAVEAESREAAAAQSAAQQAATAADAALDEATAALATAQQRVDFLRRVVAQLADRDEADRLAARLTKISAIEQNRAQISAELSAIAVTEAVAHRAEAAAAALDRVDGQLALVSATVEFTAAADIDLVTGDQRVALTAGHSWSTTATGPTEVTVAGVLTARFVPGFTARDVNAKHAAAQHELTEALRAGRVADLADARRADRRRRELESSRDQLSATLDGLRGDDQIDQLHARLAQLRAGLPAGGADIPMDSATARAELETAETDRTLAASVCDARRKAAAVAAARLAETVTRTTVLRDKLLAQRAELDAVTDRLAQQRGAVTDDDLAAAADADRRAEAAAGQRVAGLTEELNAAGPDAVATELADAAAAAEALRARYEETDRALREVNVELAVFGTEGRQGKLDAAQISWEHAKAEHVRVGRRARAAELLRSVMARHRDTTRLRYVEPFRTELQRLGRPVFGPSFEVDVDSDLRICSRTLEGRTVPYESLSGGAKEQLGILARLAGTSLVAKEDSVPVLIDDALGFTDPDRLAKMSEVFGSMGAQGQVIVLTCTPARYDGVEGAHRISLSA
jgi:AAA ATPase domain